MIKAVGTIRVQQKYGRVALQLSRDFSEYYIWLIEQHFKVKVGGPLHGPHVSLALPKFDKNVDWNIARKYSDKKHEIVFSPYIRVGGQRQTFRNFMIDFTDDKLLDICLDMNASRRTNQFHITVANTKGRERVDWWPQQITILQ